MYQKLVTGIQKRLNKINRIKYYFITEIQEREVMSKTLSKYIAEFDYFHNTSLVLTARKGNVSIASLAFVIGATVGKCKP